MKNGLPTARRNLVPVALLAILIFLAVSATLSAQRTASPPNGEKPRGGPAVAAPLDCPYDGYEDNDTFASAYGLIESGISYCAAYICPSGDEDWFKFSVASGQEITLDLYDLPADFDLALYDPSNTYVTDSANADTTPERIVHTALMGGDYRAHIRGYNGAYSEEDDYCIRVELGEESTPTPTPTSTPSCPTDDYESNDYFEEAWLIDDGVQHTAYICPSGDEDWFRLYVAEGQEITVDLYGVYGDLPDDFDVYLYNPSEEQVAGSALGDTAPEQFTHIPEQSGQYRIQVIGYAGAWSTDPYRLLVTLEDEPTPTHTPTATPTNTPTATSTATPTPTPTQETGCPETESDDDFDSATSLTLGSDNFDYICCGEQQDVDFFSLWLDQGDSIIVTLEGLPADYALALYEQDAPPAVITSDNPGTENEQINWTAALRGPHYIKVFSAHGQCDNLNPYNLRVVPAVPTRTPTATPTCPADEAGNTFGQATDIVTGTERIAHICPAGDQDWFKFPAIIGQEITVQLYNLPADYELELYSPSNTWLVSGGQSGTSSEQIFHTATTDGDYRVRVFGVLGASSSAPYTIKVILGHACPPDRLEDNDDADHAHALTQVYTGTQTVSALSICPAGDEDWFSLNLGEDDIVIPEITHDLGQGPLQLYLVDPDKTTDLRWTWGLIDPESFRHTVTKAGLYYLRVEAKTASDTNPDYTINVAVRQPTPTPTPTPTSTSTSTPTPTATPRYPACPDTYEPNNDFDEQLWSLPTLVGSSRSSYICSPDDVDYWTVWVGTGDIIQITVDHPGQTYEIELYDPDRVFAGFSSPMGSGHKVFLARTAEKSGDWYVKVAGPAGASDSTRPYEIKAKRIHCPDIYEPNNSFDVAKAIPTGQPIEAHICHLGDVDFYKFPATAGQYVTLDLTKITLPGQKMTLYDPWRRKLSSSTTWEINQPIRSSGDYYVKIEAPGDYDPYVAYGLEASLSTLSTYPEVDLQLTDMEVVQSVQSLNNDVPLIVNKPTYVRLYVTTDASSKTRHVRGWLKVLGKTQEPCWNQVTASNQVSLEQQRGSTSLSLLCPVPWTWVEKRGVLEIVAHVESWEIDDPDTANNEDWVNLSLKPSPPLNIQIVQVRDGCPDTGACPASHGYAYKDYKDIHLAMQRMYPLNQVMLYTHEVGDIHVKWTGVYTTLKTIKQLAARQGSVFGPTTVYMGLVRSEVNTLDKYRGKPFHFGGLGSYVSPVNWVKGISPMTAAHETGHNLQMKHVKACKANGGAVEPYPYSNTEWLSAGGPRDHYGLDTGPIPIEIKLPREHADFMTYCGPAWISDYTFKKLYTQLKANAGIRAAGQSASWDPETEYLMIMGDVEPETDDVDLLPIMHMQGDEIDPDVWTNPDGDYAVRLLDAGDEVLFEQTFGLIEEPHDEAGAAITLFVPYDAGVARLVITHDGEELTTVAVSPNAPTVTLDPVTGDVSGTLTLSWTASDADGDDLTASVYLSADGGETWRLITLGLNGDQDALDTSLWPHMDQGMLRVEVNDGVNVGQDVTGPFSVAAKAPVVFALAPEDGTMAPAGLPILFTATGYDAEDGPMEGEAITWSSDRDGNLGTGTQLVMPDLSPGQHDITVTATDSDDNTATDSIQVYVGYRTYLPIILKRQEPSAVPEAAPDGAWNPFFDLTLALATVLVGSFGVLNYLGEQK